MFKIISIIIFLFFNITVLSQNNLEFKIKRQTPEPNTKMSFCSKLALKQINKAMLTGKPDSIFAYYNSKYSIFRKKKKYFIEKNIGNHNINIRIFYPNKVEKYKTKGNNKLPVAIFYHGGAFMWGDLDMYNLLSHKLAKTLNAIIVVPDYRLAPKHPYPAAVNDCLYALDWVAENIDSLGGDSKKIGLIGESAGGNLAVVTSLKNLQRKQPQDISYQILYYPSTSMKEEPFESRKYFFDSCGVWYVLNRSLLTKIKESYLQKTSDTCWQVSPLYAKYNENIPATLILTAKCDPLRDEGNALAKKMKQEGVRVKNICYSKTIHGFVCLYPIIKQGRQAIRQTKRFVYSMKN